MAFITGAKILGYVGTVVTWRRSKNSPHATHLPMIIIQVSATEDGFYSPPQCVTVAGKEALTALREAIDEALKTDES